MNPAYGDAMVIYNNSMTIKTSAKISELLRPGMGHLDWAACTQETKGISISPLLD
jgi:hypothetical protein